MALRFSHGDAGWSYTGFGDFRTRLAAEIGVYLPAMEGFSNVRRSYTAGRDREVRPIPWKNVLDPIAPLLNHADNEGYLSPADCKEISPRLRGLVARWDENDYDRIHGQKLADGMDEAALRGERLEFC